MQLEYLHPMLVHFPVALTLAGTGVLAWGTLRGNVHAVKSAFLILVLAGALAVPTYITGQVARAVLEDSGTFDRDPVLADRHEDMGLYTMAVLVSLGVFSGLAFRKGAQFHARPWPHLVLALAACAMVVATAWLGGRLVFEQGVGVRAPVVGAPKR